MTYVCFNYKERERMCHTRAKMRCGRQWGPDTRQPVGNSLLGYGYVTKIVPMSMDMR